MANQSATIVQRLWNYCNVLRDDGVSYGDYVEQLTYLLFLKMADEQVRELGKDRVIPEGYGWNGLLARDGDELETHYRHILAELGKGSGLIPVIFRKAQNRIQDPAKLRRLLELIDSETWIGLDMDVKGEIYEGLLEKNAQDIKSGAGQYFTPRPLIQAIVDVMRPAPRTTICDPASGAPRGAVVIIPERKGGKPVGSAVYLSTAEAYPAGGGPQARTRLKPGEHAARGGTPSRPQGCKPKPEHGYARNLCQKRPEGQHPGNRWRWGGSHRVANLSQWG